MPVLNKHFPSHQDTNSQEKPTPRLDINSLSDIQKTIVQSIINSSPISLMTLTQETGCGTSELLGDLGMLEVL